MALNFPSSPTAGQTHNATNGLSYHYDGVKWTVQGTYASSAGAQQYKIDNISSDFNGSTTTFNLRHNSSTISISSALDVTISVGGVLQEPETAYTVNPTASTITFTEAPPSGASFFGILKSKLADQNVTVSDGAIVTSKLGGLAVTTAKLADNSVNSAKIIDDTIVNADVKSDAAIVSSKLSFTQSSTGGTARTIFTKLNELISVKDFGAVGNGSTDDTTAIKNAIAAGDGVNIVYFPAGTYIVKEPIIIPSNSYIKGAGGAYTSIKMDSSIGRLTGLGVIGTWDTTTENVLVEDITFDFNTARWHGYTAQNHTDNQEETNHTAIYSNVKTGTYSRSGTTVTVTISNHGFEIGETVNVDCTSGTGTDEEQKVVTVADANTFTYTSGTSATSSGNCSVKALVNCANRNALTIYNSKYITLNRVRCLHGQRHSLDITSPFRRGGTGTTSDTSYYATATTYMHKGAQYITVNDCYFTGAGDDNLTTHFSSDISITNCLSESPRGGYSTGTNTNCFEIDDGSRNVQLYNNRAYKGNQGLEIKGHGYAPAPYNVIVDGLEIINCVGGVEAHHSNWKTQTAESGTAWSAHGGHAGKTGTYSRSSTTVTVSCTSHGYSVGDEVTVRYTTDSTGTNLISDVNTIASVADANTFTYTSAASGTATGNCSIVGIPVTLIAGFTSNQLTSLSDDGHSATANNLTLNNIQIIAPCNQTFKKKGSSGEDTDASESTPQRCFEIGAYNGVQINNLLCSDGTRDRNLSADGYENTDTLSNHKVVIVHNSARNVQINNLTINGFYDTAEIGLKIDDLVNEGITINNFNVIDGPLQALYAEAPAAANTGPVYIGSLDNYNIYQTRTVGTSTGSDTADGTAWTSLTAALQYAINFQPSQFHVGSGTIKGYNTDQGVRPLEYLPLIWGSDHDSTTSIRTMDTGDIDDTKYILNGNVCTVFMKQANLKLASTAATGTLRIMLPFRPLEAGFPAAVYSDRLDLANTYATITTNVVNEYVYSNSTTKKGYIHLKGVRDNNTAENIDCSEIEANASSNATDIIFNLTYIIDESADPNF